MKPSISKGKKGQRPKFSNMLLEYTPMFCWTFFVDIWLHYMHKNHYFVKNKMLSSILDLA